MSHKEITRLLKKFKENKSQEYGILFIGIFGSFARNEEKKDSDIDIVVKIKKQDLFKIIGIKQDLEDIFQIPVDIISYRDKMNPFLKKRIDREAIYV